MTRVIASLAIRKNHVLSYRVIIANAINPSALLWFFLKTAKKSKAN